jgi:hypothetical protein
LNKCTIKIKHQVVLLIISTENHNISLTWVKLFANLIKQENMKTPTEISNM